MSVKNEPMSSTLPEWTEDKITVQVLKKIQASHTRYWALGPELIPV